MLKTSLNWFRSIWCNFEIWQHTDAHKPANEDDIVRIQDDFVDEFNSKKSTNLVGNLVYDNLLVI